MKKSIASDKTSTMAGLQHRLLEAFRIQGDLIRGNATPLVNRLRNSALKEFEAQGFPSTKMESWRFTDLETRLMHDFTLDFRNQSRSFDVNEIFTCDVYDLDTFSVNLLNGWYVYKHAPLTRLADGTVIGSLARAMEVYPELIDSHLGQAANTASTAMTALNTAFLQDGLFVYVPEGVRVEKPIQLINIVNSKQPLLIQPRHLVIAGRDSRLTLVHCDHSLTHSPSFTNTVLEIFVGERAFVDHYKIQNKGRESALLTSNYYVQEKDSHLQSNMLTLNGGFTRNMVQARLTQPGCRSEHSGLYLVDNDQHADNQILIDHAAPDCESDQLFKGILDDEAQAVFSGKVMVHRDAQRTRAYQNNKNLLLTDQARVNTQPFLEIYADDVKCSHGATIGQLDPDAMFYLKSRGICEKTARQMMMYAYANEVVRKISIDALRQRLDRMVEKRLKGELSICDQCVLHCSGHEPATFNIDMSKV